MAARFTKGDSIASTRRTVTPNPTFNSKNTMKGLPGYVKTTQDASSSGLAGGPHGPAKKSAGPHREGSIGKKGGSRAGWQGAANAGGSMDKSYKDTSTAKAGSIRKLGQPKAPASRGTMESLRGRAKSPSKSRMY